MADADSGLTALGKRLRELRNDRGLSLDALAKLSGCSAMAISRYERAKMEPGSRALLRLARALKTSAPKLLALLDEGAS